MGGLCLFFIHLITIRQNLRQFVEKFGILIGTPVASGEVTFSNYFSKLRTSPGHR